MSTIPVVDLAPFWENKGIVVGNVPTEDQLKAAEEIDKANIEFGFIGVKNFGLSREEVNKYFRDAKELFALPAEVKEMKMKQAGEGDFGYISPSNREVKHAQIQANKEAFKIRRERDYSHCPEEFTSSSAELFNRLESIKKHYLRATALALDVDFDVVWQMNESPEFTSMRYNHYAPFEPSTSFEQPVVRLGAHTDFGTQTFLLLSEGSNGLEIQPRGFDRWVEVQLPEEVFCVVNVGDMWETMTNGRWYVFFLSRSITNEFRRNAIRHRVMLRHKEHAEIDRYR